jgi:3-hydroxyisobutyrate dehydrogenase
MVACLGLGKMGAVLAERLVAAGHDVCGYDISAEARDHAARSGATVADSTTGACADADAVVLCLPDAAAVEAVVLQVIATVTRPPPLWIDCTSSHPAVTRRLGERLRAAGAVLVDAPVTGGVVGARSATLTAMVGGEPADVERARPLLESFASRILAAGPLGAAHAAKAINNALSSASLVATAETATAARAPGQRLAATIAAINGSVARSQNSEVKYPRDVLPGRYASGFAIGLMAKDVATACALTGDVPVPLTAVQRGPWRAAQVELGQSEDFTRIHELVARWSGDHASGRGVGDAQVGDALAGVLAIATGELLRVAHAIGLDRAAVLAIVNAGSGRNELTRLAEQPQPASGRSIADAVAALDELLSTSTAAAPVSRLAAELLRDVARDRGDARDLADLLIPDPTRSQVTA